MALLMVCLKSGRWSLSRSCVVLRRGMRYEKVYGRWPYRDRTLTCLNTVW